jgi:hypothetical protein
VGASRAGLEPRAHRRIPALRDGSDRAPLAAAPEDLGRQGFPNGGKASRTARFHPKTFAAMGLAAGAQVRVRQGGGEAILPAVADASVPEGCVRVARGVAETAALGEGDVAVDVVRMEAVA